jgi:hypothetical protein
MMCHVFTMALKEVHFRRHVVEQRARLRDDDGFISFYQLAGQDLRPGRPGEELMAETDAERWHLQVPHKLHQRRWWVFDR